MNGQERMMTAIRREEPDRLPIWELIVNEPVIKALYGDISYEDFVEAEDLDGITIFEDFRIRKRLNSNTYIDEWGVTWQVEEHGIPYAVDHPIKSEEDLAEWEPPDPDADYRLDALQSAVERFKGERAIVFLGHDAFEFSHYLRGMDRLLMDYVMNPEFAKKLARLVTDYKTRVLERAAEVGADILCTGDDYAHRKAPIMSPTHFEEFVLPYLQEVVDVAKNAGVPFLKHTDGNLWPILEDLVDTGLDCLDPLEPIADMDIGRVKEQYGDRVALAGNVDCGQLLCHATEEQVVEAVKETIAKGSPGGGHIMASSNSIHPAVNPENYRVMVETAKEFGKYPIDPELIETYGKKNYISQYRL